MDRRIVTDPETGQTGWYDRDRVQTAIPEQTRWDGRNRVSLATGTQWDHETLILTAGGRWVVEGWSQWQGRQPWTRYLTDDEAREWLVRCEQDQADDRHVRALMEPDSGDREPPRVGRPEVGPEIKARIPADVLTRIDAQADAEGVPRAALIRRVLERAFPA